MHGRLSIPHEPAISLRWLGGFNPFGPIFGKELRTMSRRRRSYLLRVGYLAALLLLLLVAHAAVGDYGGGASGAVQRQNDLGRAFFACLALFGVGAMALVGPVLTATAINGERLAQTLAVLLMTPVTATQIVLGKLLSRLLAALTLIGLSLPALAVVRLLGGVELDEMVGAVALSAATALAGASVGLLLSTVVRRGYAVILLSYLALFAAWVVAPTFVMVRWGVLGSGGVPAFAVAAAISPVFSVSSMAAGGWAGVDWRPGVAVLVGASAACAAAAVGLVKWTVRREGAPVFREGAPVFRERASTRRSRPPLAASQSGNDARIAHAAKPQAAGMAGEPGVDEVSDVPEPVARRRDRREVGDHAILWRERRQPLIRGRWQALAGAALTVILLGLSYWATGDDLADRDAQTMFAWVFTLLAWLLASVLGATAIAQEKESDTWTALIVAPVSGRSVVWGKAAGVAWRLRWPAALVAGHLAAFTIVGAMNGFDGRQGLTPLSAALVAWVIFTFNSVWVATGIHLSLRLAKPTVAVMLNLSAAAALFIALPLTLAAVAASLDWGANPAEAIAWAAPYFYETNLISHIGPDADMRVPWPLRSVSPSSFAGLTVVAGLVHLTLAGLILSWTARRFDGIVGRAA